MANLYLSLEQLHLFEINCLCNKIKKALMVFNQYIFAFNSQPAN